MHVNMYIYIYKLASRICLGITYELASELEIELSDPAVSLVTEPGCLVAPRR